MRKILDRKKVKQTFIVAHLILERDFLPLACVWLMQLLALAEEAEASVCRSHVLARKSPAPSRTPEERLNEIISTKDI